MMEEKTKKILSVITVDKRETERKSTLMEKYAFVKSVEDLKNDVNITEIVTDGHLGITATMSKISTLINASHVVSTKFKQSDPYWKTVIMHTSTQYICPFLLAF